MDLKVFRFKDKLKNIVGVAVELHKHTIVCGETCFVLIYLLQKGTQIAAITFDCFPVFHNKKTYR